MNPDLDITLPCGCIATFRSQSQFTEASWEYCNEHDPVKQELKRVYLLSQAEIMRDLKRGDI